MTPEQRRVREIVDEQWRQREPVWRVTVDTSTAASWSDRLVTADVRDLPLTRVTAARWRAATGLGTDDYLGHVLSALAQSAVTAGALVFPEPGEVRICFAWRDPETEDETGLGWGFTPAATEHLRIEARHGIPIDEVAGGPDVTGAAAARRAIELTAQSLNDAHAIAG